MATLLLCMAACSILLGALMAQCAMGASSPALRHARHLRRSQDVDEVTSRIAQDIAVKVSNVSSVTQLYSLMVQYNKQYCDDAVVKELEKLAKSREDEATLLSMKAHCRKFKQRHMARSLQRREVRGALKLGSEAQEIEVLVKKFQRTKTGCKPKSTLVEFPQSAESVYLPRCTNVKRCSGCCPNKLHICRPVQIQTVKRKVVDIRVNAKDHKPLMKVKVMEVEQHSKCECGCKVTQVQCPPQQEYDEQNCSCRCRFSHEMKHCYPPRIWNSDNCKCECLASASCGLGHYRDPETCRCLRSQSLNNLTIKLRKRNRNSEKPR